MIAIRTATLAFAGLLLAATPAWPATETVIYSFKGGHDGAGPTSTLVKFKGALWGATYLGGDPNACSPYGCGTIYRLSLDGTETVTHRLKPSEGGAMYGGLAILGDAIYGTTSIGGPQQQSRGTVFKITPDGKFTVLHVFGGAGDGANPYGTLVAVNGTLYGTTFGGGSAGQGTVFQITPAGAESVLYSFQNGTDAGGPIAGVISAGGDLYGVGQGGGIYGWGAIYKVTLAGQESLAYSFSSVADGYDPIGGLIKAGNAVYGTTEGGGACELGCGTVFKFDLNGNKTTLHDFTNGSDGALPDTSLVHLGGVFYGVTQIGGPNTCYGEQNGCGVLYSVSPSGQETVLHSFGGKGDGSSPSTGLTNVDGLLYGTTYDGGAKGGGTVYTFAP
jgi:uncharacterized repeat protein (TIGR03803 family)